MQDAALEPAPSTGSGTARPMPRRAFPYGVLLRISFASACIATVAFAAARAFLLPISQQAVLSAPLVEIRAPIDGQVHLAISQIGQRAERGAPFARIVNNLEDNTELLRIERQLAELRASVQSSTQLEQQLGQARDRFKFSANRFRFSKTDELAAAVSEGVAGLREAQLQRDKKAQVLERLKPQAAAGVVSAVELEGAESDLAIAEGAVTTAEARLAHSQAIQRAAASGAFLAGADGSSYVQQRNDTLNLQLGDQMLRSEMLRSQEVALEQQRERAIQTLAAKREQSIDVQQTGRVWELHVAEGAFVSKGQVMARLVNCEQMLIAASVSTRTFARLSLGDRGSFQSNDRRKHLTGVVRQLLGPTSWWGSPVAVQVPLGPSVKGETDARNGVVLEVDSKDAACRVGEAGEIAFGSGLWVTINQLLALPF